MNIVLEWTTGIATLGLAIFTGVVVLQNNKSVKLIVESTSAANKEADATSKLASETSLNRELQFRPFLVIDRTPPFGNERPNGTAQGDIRNLGEGIALDVLIGYRHYETYDGEIKNTHWTTNYSDILQVGSNQPSKVTFRLGNQVNEYPSNEDRYVIFCRDIFNNYFVFSESLKDCLPHVNEFTNIPELFKSYNSLVTNKKIAIATTII